VSGLFARAARRLRTAWRRLGRGIPSSADVPPPGRIDFGDLRRLEPFSEEWGYERGGPIDRHYIEGFLHAHRTDVRGRVLEIGEDVYTRAFGDRRVERADILQYEEGESPRATFTGDLADAPHLPSDAFDCFILTQTLQLVYDTRAALATVHRILRPGGVVLITAPGVTHVNRKESGSWGPQWCWSFTERSMERLLRERFEHGEVEVRSYGNLLSATGFLYGLGQDDLTRAELDAHDPDYEFLVAARARKAEAAPSKSR